MAGREPGRLVSRLVLLTPCPNGRAKFAASRFEDPLSGRSAPWRRGDRLVADLFAEGILTDAEMEGAAEFVVRQQAQLQEDLSR